MRTLITGNPKERQLALFTTHNDIFKLCNDQRHIFKLYLAYLDALINAEAEIDTGGLGISCSKTSRLFTFLHV